MEKYIVKSELIACLAMGVTFAVGAGERRLSLDDYRNKMQGAWIGQMVGVEWGQPTEYKWRDAIIPADKVPEWNPAMINSGFGNDDLYVEMTFLKTLEKYGLDVSMRQAGIDFANSKYPLWAANVTGRDNLRKGIAPPDCSHPQFNACGNDIDYQIEADYSGIIAPGLPQEAIRLGGIFGRLMNFGDGVHAGQFVGAMYAMAFFTSDVEALLDAGLAAIPPDSEYAGMVRDVRTWARESPDDWTKTWERIRGKYSKKYNDKMRGSNGGIDVRLNGAMIVLGLVYGRGDFDKSMEIAMRGGWDSDCNPSSVGGVLMCAHGARGLDAKYISKLDRKRKFLHTDYDFGMLCEVCEKLARQVVLRHGGRIEKDENGCEWMIIPDRLPKPDAYEPTWRAAPAVGLRFTKEEMQRIERGVPAELAERLRSKDPTVRVQASLDWMSPGWKTSANGDFLNPGARPDIQTTVGMVAQCFVTHPPAKDVPVVLSRRLKIPTGEPRLHFEVSNVLGGDFCLEVRVDGTVIVATEIAMPATKEWRIWLRPFDVSLEPWIDREVTIEIVQKATGWDKEGAVWHDVQVKANN